MVTHTPYENESGMSNVPPETLRALRTFLWTHGITTTIAGLSEILHDFGPNWHDTANQIGSVIGAAPTTSIEERQRLGDLEALSILNAKMKHFGLPERFTMD